MTHSKFLAAPSTSDFPHCRVHGRSEPKFVSTFACGLFDVLHFPLRISLSEWKSRRALRRRLAQSDCRPGIRFRRFVSESMSLDG